MARQAGRAPRPSSTRNDHHRTSTRGARGQAWIIPLLLFLLGVVVVVLGQTKQCLDLSAGTPGAPAGEVCQSNPALGAVIFAGICWAAALFVWLVGRRR